uniref:Uncharacterized protein n=1 Tax=Yoonia rhodophyticola TaxID=3137370 RepID=A0AAN0NIE7_9RHOB
MRAPVIMMQQKIKPQMQQCRPAQRHHHWRPPHQPDHQRDTPKDDRIVDPKNALPRVREIQPPEHHFWRRAKNLQVPPRHQIKRQIGQ